MRYYLIIWLMSSLDYTHKTIVEMPSLEICRQVQAELEPIPDSRYFMAATACSFTQINGD